MKKIFTVICCLLFPLYANANYHDALIANIQYDWINKTEMEKDEIINEIHDIMFENPVEKRKDLRKLFKDRLKDKNHIENYYAASAGYKEFKGNNISAFYAGKSKNIYMYALQDKKDVTKTFYYDALGNLRYIDFMEGEYPDYPYYTFQYRISGKPVSAIYSVSKDCQYMYTPDGDFEGVWYKHNMYNKKNKIILKRTTY